jgi:hypothetical protein
MTLGSTQPVTEMSTRNLNGGKGRLARKADNLTGADCLENVGASTACYGDSSTSATISGNMAAV